MLKAALFERFQESVYTTHTNSMAAGVISLDDLKQSIQNEITRILSNRNSINPQHKKNQNLTVLDYGIPDVSGLLINLQNPDDQAQLALQITQAIKHFEPRVQNVRVTIEDYQSVNLKFIVQLTLKIASSHPVEHAFQFLLEKQTTEQIEPVYG